MPSPGYFPPKYGRYTLPTPEVLKECIEDLYNELRWLVCAATEWDAEGRRGSDGPQPCFHIQVYAMDSALLHARSLYEFFTATDESIRRNRKKKPLTWRDFGARCRQSSATYDRFIKPLHGRVMHLCWDRTGFQEVKSQVAVLALDLLGLWDGFCAEPEVAPYSALLRRKRDEAIGEARRVAKQYAGRAYRCPFN